MICLSSINPPRESRRGFKLAPTASTNVGVAPHLVQKLLGVSEGAKRIGTISQIAENTKRDEVFLLIPLFV